MKREEKAVLNFIGSIWLVMPLYILLHEGGHALVALFYGAKIIEVSIMNGYVVAEGGAFNEIGFALFYGASILVPTMVFTIYLIIYEKIDQKVRKRTFYRVFSAGFAVVILFTISVWIILPAQYMLGIASSNDDVTQFIEVLKISPLSVMLIAILIMGIYSWVIWKKQILQKGYRALKVGATSESEVTQT